jgi:hypothetical protein
VAHGLREPWGRALNSARGAAMLAVFDFARWAFFLAGGSEAKTVLAAAARGAIAPCRCQPA